MHLAVLRPEHNMARELTLQLSLEQTPKYLQKMKARHAMKLQSLHQDEYNRIREQQDKVKLLSPEERSELLSFHSIDVPPCVELQDPNYFAGV